MKRALITALCVFTLLSCGSSGNRDRDTLMFLHYFTGNLSQGIEQLTETVNRKQKDINLIATPLEHEEFKINIRLQLDSDNPPDMFSYWAGAKTAYLVDRGKVAPIGDLLKNVPLSSDFDESVLQACSYDGLLYMLPLTQHYVGFFYNRAIFDRLDLEEPETWDDFMNIVRILSGSDLKPFSLGAVNRWPAQFWFDYLLLRTKGFHFRENLMKGSVKYTDEDVLSVMEIWKDLLDSGYFNSDSLELTWDQAASQVIDGSAAMTLMGTWIIPYFQDSDFKAGEDFGFFPFPEMNPTIEKTALGPIDGALMSANSKKKAEVGKILQILADKDSQRTFNEHSGAIAPHKGVEKSIYSDIQLEIIDEINRSPFWAFNYDLATEPERAEAGLDFFVDFLGNPDDYETLAAELQSRMDRF